MNTSGKIIKLKNGEEIMLEGSLSEVISRSLTEMYKLESVDDDDDSEVTTESMGANTIKTYGVVYSVRSIDVRCKDLIYVSNISNTLNPTQILNTVMIIEGEPTIFSLSLDKLCQRMNIPVFDTVYSYRTFVRKNKC
jgi:hypothetical protein